MPYHLIEPLGTAADPIAAELALLPLATQPVARIWSTQQSLVVPRSYRRHPSFEVARARFAAQGCPVFERPSGGGLVPQGPGILNLSLAWSVADGPGRWMEPIYHHLCGLLQQPLAELGIETHWQAVPGSFCDGRFNLACGAPDRARKIAGTAQYWRRQPTRDEPGSARYTVLAHALLLVDVDLQAAHARANAFEQALGSDQRYDPARTVSVAQELGSHAPPDLMTQVTQSLVRVVQYAEPPGLAP